MNVTTNFSVGIVLYIIEIISTKQFMEMYKWFSQTSAYFLDFFFIQSNNLCSHQEHMKIQSSHFILAPFILHPQASHNPIHFTYGPDNNFLVAFCPLLL